MRRIDHIYVCKLVEIYEDVNFLYMVFENYAGRELKYLVQELIVVPEKTLAEIIFKLLTAVNHIH